MADQQPDVWGSVVPVDVIGGGDVAARRGASGGGVVIGVLALVISLVAAAGIFAAATLSGGGTQPEEVLPGTTVAFGKIDLDPPAGQKLAIRELASKFPKAPAKEAEGLRDEILRSMLEDSETGLSYERDVKPWLGRRAGVAAFENGGELVTVVAIQTEDRGKTEDAIRKSGEEAAFDFRKGYVILAEDAQVLDAALNATDSGSLAQDPDFRADLAAIGSEQVALGWFDNAAFTRAMTEDGDSPMDQVSGRSILGLHAARDHVELESVEIGGKADVSGGEAGLLRRLPDDTVAALLVHDPSGLAQQAMEALGALGYLGGGLYFPFFFGFGPGFEDYDGVVCSAVPVAPGEPAPPPETCEPIEEEDEGDPTPYGGDYGKAGELFEKSVLPLLKRETALALGSVPVDEDSPFAAGLVARVNAPGNALGPFGDLLKALGVEAPPRISGDVVYAATEAEYTDKLVDGGSLGEQDLFRTAMGDLGGSLVGALYVDLDRIEKALPDYPEEAAPIDALGVSVTTEGDRVSTRLRVVVR